VTKVRGRLGLPTIGDPGFPLRGAGARVGDSGPDPAPRNIRPWGGGGGPLPRRPGLCRLPLSADGLGQGLVRVTRKRLDRGRGGSNAADRIPPRPRVASASHPQVF